MSDLSTNLVSLGRKKVTQTNFFQVSGTFFDHRTVSVYQNNPECDPSNIGAVHKSKQIYSYLAFLRPTWSKLTLETVSIQSSRACSCNNFRCWPPVCTCPYHQLLTLFYTGSERYVVTQGGHKVPPLNRSGFH